MSEKMPSPEELNRIQKENLTEEEIAKDKKREEAYWAGYSKHYQENKESDKRSVEMGKKYLEDYGEYKRIEESVKNKNIQKGEKVLIFYKGNEKPLDVYFDSVDFQTTKLYYFEDFQEEKQFLEYNQIQNIKRNDSK